MMFKSHGTLFFNIHHMFISFESRNMNKTKKTTHIWYHHEKTSVQGAMLEHFSSIHMINISEDVMSLPFSQPHITHGYSLFSTLAELKV